MKDLTKCKRCKHRKVCRFKLATEELSKKVGYYIDTLEKPILCSVHTKFKCTQYKKDWRKK